MKIVKIDLLCIREGISKVCTAFIKALSQPTPDLVPQKAFTQRQIHPETSVVPSDLLRIR